jgi:hypothetical protein
MTEYTYTKSPINSSKLAVDIQSAGLAAPSRIDTNGQTVMIYFESALDNSQKEQLDSIVSRHQTMDVDTIVGMKLDEAMIFGFKIMKSFIIQNIKLGITERGLTNHVRKTLREVKDAAESGSLKDVVTEIRSLNEEDFDDAIITPARLLAVRNEVETWLEVPLAEAWDDPETWL